MLWVIVIACVLLAFLIYVFPVIQVCGESMFPTLNDGDIVLGCRLFHIKKNSIYVFHPPVGEKYVIKRLTQVSPYYAHKLFFEGDNPEYSYDSRMYGYISKDKIVAKYLFTIHKKSLTKKGE